MTLGGVGNIFTFALLAPPNVNISTTSLLPLLLYLVEIRPEIWEIAVSDIPLFSLIFLCIIYRLKTSALFDVLWIISVDCSYLLYAIIAGN